MRLAQALQPRTKALYHLRIHSRSPNISSKRGVHCRPDHPISPDPLHGTTPEHDAWLVLHTSRPPSSWPPRIEASSPLLRELKRKLSPLKGTVTFAYTPTNRPTNPEEVETEFEGWDEGRPEAYAATLYRAGSSEAVELARVDGQTDVRSLLVTKPAERQTQTQTKDEVHFYVCTHGSRDCRCGDVGADVADTLREEVGKLPSSAARERVKVSEVAHVGGHVWAANVLVYPSGDWFGNVRPKNVPSLLSLFVPAPNSPLDYASVTAHPLFRTHWRGRMGLSKDQQTLLYNESLPKDERVIAGEDDGQKYAIPFTTWDGSQIMVDAKPGQNLMEVAKAAGLPSIEGICGGQLECATCHVYMPPMAPVHPPTEAEEDMLEYAIGRKEGESRLG
ncbi:hypothetical protein FRB90_001626, partial [Tulasnella sp. 427]